MLVCSIAEYHGSQTDEEKAQSPGCEHGINQPAIQPSDYQTLDYEADNTDYKRGDNEHGEKYVNALIDRYDRRIATHHQEFAMCEVDYLHHAEYHSKSGTDQNQKRDGINHFNGYNCGKVHGAVSSVV